MATSPALFKELSSFLTQIGTEKKADAAKDPGGYVGASSHATAKQTGADANLQAPSEGARSSENEADVKKTIPNNVNTTAGNTGTQDSVQLGIGVKAKETGEDVPSVKGDKEDPGTSHPATTENGEKYGSYSGKPFAELYKQAGVLANNVLASIAVAATQAPAAPVKAAGAVRPTAPAAPAAPAAPVVPSVKPATEAVKAAEAGYRLADLLSQPTQTPEQIKQANTKIAVEQVMRDAIRAAELTASFEHSYISTKQAQAQAAKRAADESDSESGSEGGEKKEPAESEPSEGGEGGGGGPPPEAGGGGGGGGDPLAAMGGMGGDPMGGMGGPPPGGGGDPGQAVQQLLMALTEMGITPDMLLQGAQGLQGGPPGGDPMGGMGGPPPGGGGDPLAALMGGGGPPPGAGGPPPGMGAPPGMEVAASVKAAGVKAALIKLATAAKEVHAKGVKAGTFRFQPAKTAQEQQLRSQIQGCVREIMANK